jgi:phosphoinositide-3-kinase regulatory subunit 4
MFSIARNCFPFVSLQLTEKAGFIMREYVKYSLYDRISTRPFLTDIEKRWIAFQVLYALHQCHKVGVSDIYLVYLYSTVISHLCFFYLLV